MLAYMCKNCGKFTFKGLVNEFEEHFCNKRCYEKYCEKQQYTINLDKLKKYNR